MPYSQQLLASLGTALGSGALVRELLAAGSFSPMSNGAIGDYSKDDTQAIQTTIDKAVAAGSGSVIVIPPGTYKVQDPTTAVDNSQGAITIPPEARELTILGFGAVFKIGENGVSESVVRCYGARCNVIGVSVDQNYSGALQTGKDNTGFEINGTTNASIGTVTGTNGKDCLLAFCRTYGGDTSDNLSPNQGTEGIKLTNATDCGMAYCSVKDCTFQAYRIEGDGNWMHGCYADNFRGNGLRVLNAYDLFVDRCTFTSSRNAGRHALIIDPGSGADSTPLDDTDFRAFRTVIRDCYLYCNSDGSQEDPAVGSATLKLASAYDVLVEGCTIIAGKASTSSPNDGVRLEDGLYRTTFRNCYIYPNIVFSDSMGRLTFTADAGTDVVTSSGAFSSLVTGQAVTVSSEGTLPAGLSPATLYYVRKTNSNSGTLHATSAGAIANTGLVDITDAGSGTHYIQGPTIDGAGSVLQGDIGSTVANNGGYVQYTISNSLGSAGVGKTLFVRGSSVADYNGPQQITARTDFTVTTNRLYRSASIGSNCVGHTGVDQVYFYNCTIEGIHELSVWLIETYNARVGVFENCTFKAAEQETNKKSAIMTKFLDDRFIDTFRLVNNTFAFKSSVSQWCVRPHLVGDRCFVTSGKVICHGNETRNEYNAGSGAPGTVNLIDTTLSDESTATFAERAVLFATDGENRNRFRGTAKPSSALFNWTRGDVVVNTTPSAAGAPGFVCVTSGAGSASNWRNFAVIET